MDVQTTITDIDEITKKFDFVVNEQQIKQTYNKKLADLVKKVSIKGFRKGKAPKNIVENIYSGALYSETIEDTVQKCIADAVTENNLNIVEHPKVDFGSEGNLEDLKFSATFVLFPEPTVTGYDNLEVEVPAKRDVSEEDIDKAIHNTLERKATYRNIESRNTAQEGDILDMKVSIISDGQAPTTPEPFRGKLGSDELIKEVNDVMLGASVGDIKEAEKTFSSNGEGSEEHHVKYSIELCGLLESVLPELTDELVKEFGIDGVDNVSAYREHLREVLEKAEERAYQESIQEAAFKALRESNQFKIPQSFIDDEIRSMVRTARGRVNANDGEEENIDMYRDALSEGAEVRVRDGIIMRSIARQEGIKIEDADIDKKAHEIVEQWKDAPKEMFDKICTEINVSSDAKNRILSEKILDFIRGKAKVTIKKGDDAK